MGDTLNSEWVAEQVKLQQAGDIRVIMYLLGAILGYLIVYGAIRLVLDSRRRV
jgi:hypothetical protein